LKILDETSEYDLTGSIISNDRYAINFATKALENAIVLEDVAEMAMYTYILGQTTTKSIAIPLFKKHFDRKNGKERYYGQ
jgi:hypothetical protein